MYRPNQIVIGDHSVINYGVLLDGRGGLNIGDNVSISEGTIILTMGHDIDAPDFRLKGGRVMIDDYVFIGSYTRILPGVTVGEGAVVGVGSVVTKDVDPYTVVGGVPARYIRDRSQDLSYQLHHRKRFG
jgi:maltose O-acetyltransferase